MNRVYSTNRIVIDEMAPLPEDQVVEGSPMTGLVELTQAHGLDIGVWEHTVGTSTDIEADEVFIVLAGRATVIVADGAGETDGTVLELEPGTVGVLEAGTATTWQIHEPLRKVYLMPSGRF